MHTVDINTICGIDTTKFSSFNSISIDLFEREISVY